MALYANGGQGIIASEISEQPDTRDRILLCAEELFGRRGYDSVAVSDIAESCDVSTSLIYYHFDDKESLLRALSERAAEVFAKTSLTALDGDDSPRKRLETYIQAKVRATFEHQDLFRMLMRSFLDQEGPMSAEMLEHASSTIERIAEVISEGIKAGDFDKVDPVLAAECLFALTNTRVVAGMVKAPHDHLVGTDTEQTANFITTLFMEGICSC